MPCPIGYVRGKSGLAKLTAKQVKKARKDYAAGKATQTELSVRLGISQTSVNALLQGKTYRWCLEKAA